MATYCPVCDKRACGHLDIETARRETFRLVYETARQDAKIPLDHGFARFAAEMAAMLVK